MTPLPSSVECWLDWFLCEEDPEVNTEEKRKAKIEEGRRIIRKFIGG